MDLPSWFSTKRTCCGSHHHWGFANVDCFSHRHVWATFCRCWKIFRSPLFYADMVKFICCEIFACKNATVSNFWFEFGVSRVCWYSWLGCMVASFIESKYWWASSSCCCYCLGGILFCFILHLISA